MDREDEITFGEEKSTDYPCEPSGVKGVVGSFRIPVIQSVGVGRDVVGWDGPVPRDGDRWSSQSCSFS